MRAIATRVAKGGAAITAAFLLTVLALTAQPAAAQAPQTTASQVGITAAKCHYRVTGDGVHVRRNPNTSSDIIKVKNSGDHVSGPLVSGYCWIQVWNDGWWWAKVHLASGETGWMASAYLHYRGYW